MRIKGKLASFIKKPFPPWFYHQKRQTTLSFYSSDWLVFQLKRYFAAGVILCDPGVHSLPPEGQPSFYATRGTTWLSQRSFYSTRGTAKARPNMPGSEVGRRPASRFLNLGKNNSYLGNMIKNNSYPAETHKSNQQLGSKSIFLITLEQIVPWRIVKSLLDRPDKDYLLTKVETQAVVTYLEKKVQIKLFMKLALEDIRSNNIMSGPTVCPLIQTMDLR